MRFPSSSPHRRTARRVLLEGGGRRGFHKKRGILVFAAFVFTLSSVLCTADAFDLWRRRNPGPVADRLFGVASSPEGFVAVGLGGAIARSLDGVDWFAEFSPLPEDLYAVASGGGVTVAVGGAGTILRTDGTVWVVDSQTGTLLNGVAYGAGQFVAVGDSGASLEATILVSDDGLGWTPRSSGQVGTLTSIAHGNGMFVAAGEFGLLLVSTNALSWTAANGGTLASLNSVTFWQGRFFVTAGSDLLTSTDGVDWEVRPTGAASGLYSAGGGTDLLVAVGSGVLVTSTNGTDWMSVDLGTNAPSLFGVAYNGSSFVAVGNRSTAAAQVTSSILGSFEGRDWLERTTGVAVQVFNGVAFGNGRFVAVGAQDVPAALPAAAFSVDGAVWHRATLPAGGNLSGVAHGADLFVAAGSYTNTDGVTRSGRLFASADGENWVDRTPTGAPALLAIARSAERFVAVGATGAMYSTDGMDWRISSSGTATNLMALAYGEDGFVGVGTRGTIQTSPDGEVWTTQVSGTTRALRGVAFGAGRYVAVGNVGTILVSEDGVGWNPATTVLDNILFGVTWGAGMFVAVGFADSGTGYGTILTSPEGSIWTLRRSGVVQSFRGAGFGMNSHTVVGDAGVILQAGGVMAPKLGTPVWSDSGVELKVTADPGVGYWLQSAPDPSAGPWANVTRFTNTTPTEILHDRSAATRQQGYYRAVWP